MDVKGNECRGPAEGTYRRPFTMSMKCDICGRAMEGMVRNSSASGREVRKGYFGNNVVGGEEEMLLLKFLRCPEKRQEVGGNAHREK